LQNGDGAQHLDGGSEKRVEGVVIAKDETDGEARRGSA